MDAVQTGLLHSAWAPLAAAALWMIVAGLMPAIRSQRRCRTAVMALTAAGVPILGWLTYACGPAVGVLGFALGLAMLLAQPLARLRTRRPA
ncbi:DUF2484 family protein [Paracoccus suum]|uniref:DUF2484 family protein n=2 Tax=Paracoccus suum TaxID=2259340 RepID=A0A344PP42_9RHOB|nr:DUF2484 family protein [Paracoccus suum]